MIDASVIICTYSLDRWEDLCRAVRSAQVQTVPPAEIVVVVDHHPELLARVRERLAGVTVIENCNTRGLSGSRNSGVAAARGAVLVFLDDDAVAARDWLENILAVYRALPNTIGVGGSIEPLWPGSRPAWFPPEFDWVVGCTYRGMPENASPVRNLIGANMSFRREAFAMAGDFDAGMGRTRTSLAGCEETEFCIRVRQCCPDRVIVYSPAARVGHRVPAWRARWSYFLARCLAEGRSKASVARLVGAGDGLSSERSYVASTLPRAVARGLFDALRGDLAGVQRAGALLAGLAWTTWGYVAGAQRVRGPGSRA